MRADLTFECNVDHTLIEAKHIKAALKAGYQYAHLGMVRIGLNALHKKGQKACVFSPIRAIRGGIETSLAEGPVQYDV